MAKSAVFQTNQASHLIVGTESTFGTKVATDGTRITLATTEFSYSEVAAHTLGIAPFRNGVGQTQSTEMVRAQRHDRMYEINFTFLGSAQAINRMCLAMFGDDDGANALVGAMPTVTHISSNGGGSIPVSLHFEKGASTAADTAITFRSAMCTSFTLQGDIAANGGVIMGSCTFVTGFAPTNANISFSGGTSVSVNNQSNFFNMHDLSTTTITPSGGSAQDLVLYSFELNISRPVNRIGFDTASNTFNPLGYVVGGYDVTGSMVVKRDVESSDAITYADTAEPVAQVDIGDGTFQVLAPKAIIDTASINFDDDGWKTVIPFRCTYNAAATTNSVVEIHTT